MIDKNAIPTAADWGDYEADLDTKWAFGEFNQKNFAEAVALYVHCASATCENLSYMPIKPFQYYTVAISRYIRSPEFKSTIDFRTSSDIDFFLWRVITFLTDKPDFILPIWDEIDAALDKIAAMKPQKFCAACDDEPENYDLKSLAKLQVELSNVHLAHQTALASQHKPQP